jgi:hypothetical protein
MSLLKSVIIAIVAIQPAFAEDARPSTALVRELLDVTQMRTLLEDQLVRMNAEGRASAEQNLAQLTHNEKQKKIAREMVEKLVAISTSEVNWDKLEPMWIEVYQKSLTAQDVKDLIAFYKSDLGRKILKIESSVANENRKMMETLLARAEPKIQQWRGELEARLNAAK